MSNIKNVIKIKQADFDLIFNAYPNPARISTGFDVTYDPDSMYLVDELNEMYVEKTLWENPNPGSAFAPTTINISDLYQYDYIKIGYQYYLEHDNIVFSKQYITVKPMLDGRFLISNANDYSDGEISATREFQFINNGILVSNSYHVDINDTTSIQSNDFIIPIEIIGIKKGRTYQLEDKVLLWENSDPTKGQPDVPEEHPDDGMNISLLRDASDFKYLIFEWKPQTSAQNFGTTLIVKNPFYTNPSHTSSGDLIAQLIRADGTENQDIYWWRNIYYLNKREFEIGRARLSSNHLYYTGHCILLAVYGSNYLSTGSMAMEDNILRAYPVGSIYASADATNPSSLFGGTWERIEDTHISGSWINQELSSSKDSIKLGNYEQYMGKTFDVAYTKNRNVYSTRITLYPTYQNFYYAYIDTDPDLLVRFSIGSDSKGYFQLLKWDSGWINVQEGQLSVRLIEDTPIYRWKRTA